MEQNQIDVLKARVRSLENDRESAMNLLDPKGRYKGTEDDDPTLLLVKLCRALSLDQMENGQRDGIVEAVEKLLRELLDAQNRIRVLESQLNQSRDRDRALISALKCEHYETPEVAARRHVKREQELKELLEEVQGLIDPYGDTPGTVIDVVKRIRDDLEILPDGGGTSIRDAIESIKAQRDGAISARESLSAELKALKREHADGDACEIAGRILGHALAAILERPKQ